MFRGRGYHYSGWQALQKLLNIAFVQTEDGLGSERDLQPLNLLRLICPNFKRVSGFRASGSLKSRLHRYRYAARLYTAVVAEVSVLLVFMTLWMLQAWFISSPEFTRPPYGAKGL